MCAVHGSGLTVSVMLGTLMGGSAVRFQDISSRRGTGISGLYRTTSYPDKVPSRLDRDMVRGVDAAWVWGTRTSAQDQHDSGGRQAPSRQADAGSSRQTTWREVKLTAVSSLEDGKAHLGRGGNVERCRDCYVQSPGLSLRPGPGQPPYVGPHPAALGNRARCQQNDRLAGPIWIWRQSHSLIGMVERRRVSDGLDESILMCSGEPSQ